jgi:hypothetical protein
MLELLEFAIEHFYVLPAKIDDLTRQIGQID